MFEQKRNNGRPFENQSQNIKAQKIIKEKLQQNNNKFMSSTMTKNFFNSDEPQYEQEPKNYKKQSEKQENQDVSTPVKKSKNRKHQNIVLQPIKQADKTYLYQLQINKSELSNHKQIDIQEPQNHNSSENKKSQLKKRASRRRTSKKQEQFDNKPAQNSQSKANSEKQNFIQITQSKAKTNMMDLYFEQSQQENKNIPSEKKQQLVTIDIAGRQIVKHNDIFIDSQEEGPDIESNKKAIFDEDGIITGPQYFNFANKVAYHKQLLLNVRQKTVLRMEILRDKSGFNSFWPQFHLHFNQNSHYVMSAKKTSSKPSSTFIISSSRNDFQQKSQNYLGKIKSNLLGDVLNIFGPGLNPSDAKSQNVPPRQLLATIVYQSNLFQLGKPREFYVFIKRPTFSYYKDFKGICMYDQQIPLNQLNKIPENNEKIMILHNRRPVWIAEANHYFLNFKGRVEKASIKNFILQQTQNGKDYMLFGRVNDIKFNVDVYSNMSPYIAFAVALSSFDSRLMCQ